MYRKSAHEANRSIVWMDRNGKISDPIGAPIEPGAGPGVHLSPDNKRVAFATRVDGGRDDIWTYDFERHVRLRLTTDSDVDHIPIWSPDGSTLIFDSHRGGKGSSLYEIAANGAVPERVLLKIQGDDFIAASDSSRDGHYLVFHRSPTGAPPWSLWVLPLAGDRKPFAYKSSVADTIGAALSPNGRWLAYSTNESGTYQVVVQPFPDPSGGKWQVSSNGGSFPVWRRDGREIYYVAPSGDLMAVSVTVDSTFAIGKSSPLFRMPIDLAAQGSPYDVSADGTRFLVLMPTLKSLPPITTVLNWWAQLKPN